MHPEREKFNAYLVVTRKDDQVFDVHSVHLNLDDADLATKPGQEVEEIRISQDISADYHYPEALNMWLDVSDSFLTLPPSD